MISSEWGADRIDLGVYLSRVGLGHLASDISGRPPQTVRELRRLHRAHLAAIPFDNVDLVLGTPVSLEPEAIVDKLCRRRRGGCCHEHNLLFGLVLEHLGLPVERLAARVLLGGVGPRPRTHMLLKTRALGEEWLCDVGFGSDGYLDPLPVRDGAEVVQRGRRYRVLSHDRFQWSIDVHKSTGWVPLYEFTHEPRQPMDFTVAHHFLSTYPRSMLRNTVLLQLLTADKWMQLRGDLLRRVTPAGEITERIEHTDLPGVLREFGIALTSEEFTRLSRIFAQHPPTEAG